MSSDEGQHGVRVGCTHHWLRGPGGQQFEERGTVSNQKSRRTNADQVVGPALSRRLDGHTSAARHGIGYMRVTARVGEADSGRRHLVTRWGAVVNSSGAPDGVRRPKAIVPFADSTRATGEFVGGERRTSWILRAVASMSVVMDRRVLAVSGT